jgi:hypothetical protein
MYKKQCFFDPQGTNSGNSKSGIWNPRTLLCNFEIREIRPGKTCFTYALRSRYPPGISEIGTFSDIFFRNVTNLQKKCKKMQKNAKCKTSENTWNFVFLSKIGLWRFVEALKSVENDTETRAHLCTFFPEIPRGAFRGFRDFQLRIEVSEKGVFRRFLENFHFLRFTGGGRRPHFYMGRKSELAFFEKCGTRFRFWVRFCAALLEKIRPDENDDAQITYRPLVAQVSFPYAFLFRFPAVKWRQKKSERFCSTII